MKIDDITVKLEVTHKQFAAIVYALKHVSGKFRSADNNKLYSETLEHINKNRLLVPSDNYMKKEQRELNEILEDTKNDSE